MSYRSALLRRWSRRDVLAVVVVAATVAFLTGAAVVGHAATAELADVAAEFESPASATAYDDVDAAGAAAGDRAVVLPVADVSRADGTDVTVVGVPESADAFRADGGLSLPPEPPDGRLAGPVDDRQRVVLSGPGGEVSTAVVPRTGGGVLPTRWYVASTSTVERLGATGAIVLSPDAGSTPVLGALPFFVVGGRQVLRSLGLATAAAGALLGVTVFSATRMTVRDRVGTVRVARATGATPRALLSLFGARAGLQATAGVAAGYAVGVIAPNAAVNAAVFLGRPTSLSARVTAPVTAVLAPSYAALVLVGVLGGVLAALPAVRRPPGRLTARSTAATDGSPLPAAVRPAVLGWRAVVPTGTTLAVFLLVAVLLASGATVVAPLAGGDGATITEPGATHPFSSDLPESAATELRAQGSAASPEILALGVTGGDPYIARGANFPAFANVTDASVASGRSPERPGEAVVGVDLARTLNVAVGETILVGGSTRPAVDRLRVVGTYRAPEPYDDQMVVPLATARSLSGTGDGRVQFVRTSERPAAPTAAGVVVTDVDVPATVTTGAPLTVSVTVANTAGGARSRTVRASTTDDAAESEIDLGPGERRTLELNLTAGVPRTAVVTVAGETYPVTVVEPGALRVVGLPGTAPPNSEPRVRVVTAAGEPVGGATVTVGGRTVTTDAGGWTRLLLGEFGTHTVGVTHGERRTNATVVVDRDAIRRPIASITVTPDRPTAATSPAARVTLGNPWNRTLSASLVVERPGTETKRTVELAPGEEGTVRTSLARRPPGEYAVSVRSDGTRLATATYEVGGDPRLAAALATSGREGATTAVGEALSVVLGNLRLVVATLFGLAALMTVGGTTAAFASAVHARRRTLGVHRATGATPRQVLRLILGDATLIGVVATAIGLCLAGAVLFALDATGLLVVYGVRVLATVDPEVVAASAAAALGLAVLGAGLATVGLLRQSPARLLADDPSRASPGGGHDA